LNRPKIKAELEPIDRIIQSFGLIAMATLIAFPLYYFNQLPDIIPSHYGSNGEPDGFSGKAIIWTLPIIGILLYVGLHCLSYYPHIYNYPQKVTEQNAKRLYTIATKVIRFLNAQIALVFSYITYSTIHTALGNKGGLGKSFLLVFVISNVLVLGYLVYHSTQKQ